MKASYKVYTAQTLKVSKVLSGPYLGHKQKRLSSAGKLALQGQLGYEQEILFFGYVLSWVC